MGGTTGSVADNASNNSVLKMEIRSKAPAIKKITKGKIESNESAVEFLLANT